MSAEFNQDHLLSPLDKTYIVICGIITALAISYVTFLYFEYRVTNNLWETTFVSPEQFWAEVPRWEWKTVNNVK